MSVALAFIRSARLLVPAPERPEWFAEWRAELFYLEQNRDPRAFAFSLGAFKDAVWFRRQYGSRWLESPVECLSLLAAVAVISLVAAIPSLWWHPFREAQGLVIGKTDHPPAGAAYYRQTTAPLRTWRGLALYSVVHASGNLFDVLRLSGPPAAAKPMAVLSRSIWWNDFNSDPHIAGSLIEIDGTKTPVAGVVSDDAWPFPGTADVWLVDDRVLNDRASFVVARSVIRPGLRTPPRRLRNPVMMFEMAVFVALMLAPITSLLNGIRRWPFLLAKIGLILPTIYACALLGGAAHTRVIMALFSLVVCPGSVLALRWAVADQRRRCPVCLRLLSDPIRFGNASRTFLAWYGTELTCGQGHGVLRVPEVADTGTLQWVGLEEICVR